ncbi:MAG: SpoIIE family protein phosphatase [bacterium]
MFTNVEKQQLKVPAHIDYLGDLRDFVTQIGKKHRFSDKVVNAFKLAVDEAATNIIRHAYRDTDGLITIRAIVKKNSLTLSIIDQGKYFDPNRVENPDLNRYIDIGKKGGLGIFIMRKLMDEIEYSRTEEGNELRITKYRDQAEKKGIFKSAVSSIPFSIKVKYFFRAIAIIATLITVGYLYFFFKVDEKVLSKFLYDCEEINASIVTRVISTVSLNPDEPLDDEFFTTLEEQYAEIRKIAIEDSTSYIIYSTDTNEYVRGLFRPAKIEVVRNRFLGAGAKLYRYKLNNETVYEFESPIVIRPGRQIFGTAHIVFTAVSAESQIAVSRRSNLNLALLILGLSCVGVALIIYLVMNPFRKLSDWVRNLDHGQIEDEMDIDASTEIGEIAKAFSDITHKFRDSQKRVAQQDRLEREMRVAKDIQQTLLPMSVPELEGYQISAHYEAATEVGGDYYDFVEVDQDTWGIAVADVSGKGVPGSMVMTMIRTVLRTEARGVKDAADVLTRVNDFVSNDIKKGMFVTVFYLIIDSKKRSLNFASAGHNPMILRRGSTNQTYYLNPKGFPIGVKLPDKDYFKNYIESETIRLAKDDILLLYTDGITEAMNSRRALFGEERLQKVMSDSGHLSAEDFVESLKETIYSFTEGQPQSDDITLVAIKEKSTREEDELRRAKEVHSLVCNGRSVRDACQEVNLAVSTYYNKYKKVFEAQGTDGFEIDEVASVESKHLSIEQKTRIFDVIAHHPEYGAGRIKEELNTKRYDFTVISERKVYEELVRNRLNTRALREAYINRARKGKRRPKPPGTPYLTLHGEIVVQHSNIEDYTAEEETKAPESGAGAEAGPAGRTDDERSESIEVDSVIITEFESESLIHNPLDETLSNPLATDQDKKDSSEDNRDGISGGPSGAEPEVVVPKAGIEVGEHDPEATSDDVPFEALEAIEGTSLLEDFTFEELFDSGSQMADEDDFDEGSDEGQGSSVESQATTAFDADVEAQAETHVEDESQSPPEVQEQAGQSQPQASASECSEVSAADSDVAAFSVEELVDRDRESDSEKQGDFVQATAEEGPDLRRPHVADEDEDTVSFSDLIQAIDDEIVYVSKPARQQDKVAVESRELSPSAGKPKPLDGDEEPYFHKSEPGANGDQDKETILINGIKYYKNNDYAKAIEEFKKVIDVYPDYKEAHSILGNAYFRNRMYNEAALEYQRVKEIDPNDITAYENMGVIYANLGDYKQALGEWKKVMELNPDRMDIKDKIKKALRMIN